MTTSTQILDQLQAQRALELALQRQRRHEKHRERDGKPCPWCGPADRDVEHARAALVASAGGQP